MIKTNNNITLKIKIIICVLVATGCIAVGYFALKQYYGDSLHFDKFISQGQREKQQLFVGDVKYTSKSIEINRKKQEIRIIEVKPQKDVTVKPVLAQNSIFGFDTTSAMVSKNNAIAGINGAFFHMYGQPSGLVISDGEVLALASGEYPVLISTVEGSFLLEQISLKMWVIIEGMQIQIDGVNRVPGDSEIILFTKEYGLDNRFKEESKSICIKGNIVENINFSDSPMRIPKDSIILTMTGDRMKIADGIKQGMKFEKKIEFSPSIYGIQHAYECGSWLVENGELVIKEKDKWVGLMTNSDPRTAVGIKEDGTLIMVVVDGRHPGYSEGMTGKELAEFMMSEGAVNAAMLDGGASSTMVYGNEVVNRPSFMGRERIIGGALIVIPRT